MQGELFDQPFRGLRWRAFLGGAGWENHVSDERAAYEQSLREILGGRGSNRSEEASGEGFTEDEKSQAEPSRGVNDERNEQDAQQPRQDVSSISDVYDQTAWEDYFSSSEEAKEIMQDLQRTSSAKPSERLILCRLLTAYSYKHPEYHYMQGMNELITPLFIVTKNDAAFLAANR